MATHKLSRQKWQYYPELFELEAILDDLDNEVNSLHCLQDHRLDTRQEYRLAQTADKMQQLLGRAEEDKGSVPDQLDLRLAHSAATEPPPIQEDDLQQLSEVELNQALVGLLQEIGESSELGGH
jgi:hypothetical protein